MNPELDTLWKNFTNKGHFDELLGTDCRLASRHRFAKPWVLGVNGPVGSTIMRSNVPLYHAWDCPNSLNIAKGIIRDSVDLSLRELQVKMLHLVIKGESLFPYLWWIYNNGPSGITRAIHEDQNGILFVKLAGKWQLVYPCQKLGSLVGSQGGEHYEDLPRNAYFVLWENEEQARYHAS